MPKEKTPKEQNPKIKKLEKEVEELKDSRARLAADYQNFERRMNEEKEALKKTASKHLLEKLYPIFDNLYLASKHAPEIGLEDLTKLTDEDLRKIFNYFEGLKMIEGQMESVLGEAGLHKIATKGQPFDHNLHEAISYEPNTEVPEDHIIDEIEAGWQIDGQVVKPAKVRVSKG